MLINILYFLAYCLLLGAVFWLAIWVLGLLGIPVPQRPMQLLGAALFLLMLIWFIQVTIGGGHVPRLLLISPIRL